MNRTPARLAALATSSAPAMAIGKPRRVLKVPLNTIPAAATVTTTQTESVPMEKGPGWSISEKELDRILMNAGCDFEDLRTLEPAGAVREDAFSFSPLVSAFDGVDLRPVSLDDEV